jgi:hypothetical protein
MRFYNIVPTQARLPVIEANGCKLLPFERWFEMSI